MARRNPLKGVRTMTLKNLVAETKRRARRKPLPLMDALIASLAQCTIEQRNRRQR